MQIFVKNLIGRTITLDVAASDSIHLVKDMIQLKERIPPALQRLTHAGRVLTGLTIAECNIQCEDTLWLSLRICGGGKKKQRPRSIAASPSKSPSEAPESP